MAEQILDERLQELCDGYALGTLEGDELEEMRRLLDRSDAPVREIVKKTLQVSEGTVALMAWLAPPVKPPTGLRQRVLEGIEAEPGRVRSRILSMNVPGRANRFIEPMMWIGWAAAAALAVAALLINGRVRDGERNMAELREQASGLRTQVADRDRVLAVIGARDARSIRLVTTTPEAPQFRAYWSESAGLVLTGNGLAAPRAGRTLQLWIVPRQGMPISAGVFVPTANGEVLLIASNTPAPGGAQALAISDEPLGGSAQPTTQPAWVGAVGGF